MALPELQNTRDADNSKGKQAQHSSKHSIKHHNSYGTSWLIPCWKRSTFDQQTATSSFKQIFPNLFYLAISGWKSSIIYYHPSMIWLATNATWAPIRPWFFRNIEAHWCSVANPTGNFGNTDSNRNFRCIRTIHNCSRHTVAIHMGTAAIDLGRLLGIPCCLKADDSSKTWVVKW